MRPRTRSMGATASRSIMRRATLKTASTPMHNSKVIRPPASRRSYIADAFEIVSSSPCAVLDHTRRPGPEPNRRPLSTTRSGRPSRCRMTCCVGALRDKARASASRIASSLERPPMDAAMRVAWMRATACASAPTARTCRMPSVAARPSATSVIGSNPFRISCRRSSAGLPLGCGDAVMERPSGAGSHDESMKRAFAAR